MKYFYKKSMSQKEIHDNFIKTLRNEFPSYSMVKKWAAEFRRGKESMEMNGIGSLKKPLQTKTLSFCTVSSCVTEEACVI